MQPDSLTQIFALALVEVGLPAPFAALLACLALFVVPAFIGAVFVSMAERHSEQCARRRRPRGATRI